MAQGGIEPRTFKQEDHLTNHTAIYDSLKINSFFAILMYVVNLASTDIVSA